MEIVLFGLLIIAAGAGLLFVLNFFSGLKKVVKKKPAAKAAAKPAAEKKDAGAGGAEGGGENKEEKVKEDENYYASNEVIYSKNESNLGDEIMELYITQKQNDADKDNQGKFDEGGYHGSLEKKFKEVKERYEKKFGKTFINRLDEKMDKFEEHATNLEERTAENKSLAEEISVSGGNFRKVMATDLLKKKE